VKKDYNLMQAEIGNHNWGAICTRISNPLNYTSYYTVNRIVGSIVEGIFGGGLRTENFQGLIPDM